MGVVSGGRGACRAPSNDVGEDGHLVARSLSVLSSLGPHMQWP